MSKEKESALLKDIKRRWAIKCSQGELFCFLCGKKIESMKQCNADHWLPRALGGKTTEENIKPSHIRCNSLKGSIPPDEFELNKDAILNGTYHRKSYSTATKEYCKNKIKKTGKSKKHKKNLTTINIGDTVYYIQHSINDLSSHVIVKEGIVLGYTNNNTVLLKDFYLNEYNQLESQLIEVIPLSKKQAFILKKRCDKQIDSFLIQRLLQNSR